MKGNAELVNAVKTDILNAPTSTTMEKRYHKLLFTIWQILEREASDAPELWICIGELIAAEGAYSLMNRITPDFWEE